MKSFSETLTHLHRLLSSQPSPDRRLLSFMNELVAALGRLEHVPPAELLRAINTLADKQKAPGKANVGQPVRSFFTLSLDEAEALLADSRLSKTDLLRLAKERFRMPTGVLTRLGMGELLERVRARIADERSHEAIARLASDSSTVVAPRIPETRKGKQEGTDSPPEPSLFKPTTRNRY